MPRPFVLRVFAAATQDGWHVMPGGYCLISDKADARAVSMGDGVQSADVWVLSDNPVAQETLLPSRENVQIRRILGNLPSRAADNLFWFGRYLERAEAMLRIVRCLSTRSVELDLAAGEGADPIARLAGLLVAWGAVPADHSEDPIPAKVATALASESQYGSVLSSVRMAYSAASVIRERLSVDSWKLLGSLESQLQLKPDNLQSEAEAFETADRLRCRRSRRSPDWRRKTSTASPDGASSTSAAASNAPSIPAVSCAISPATRPARRISTCCWT